MIRKYALCPTPEHRPEHGRHTGCHEFHCEGHTTLRVIELVATSVPLVSKSRYGDAHLNVFIIHILLGYRNAGALKRFDALLKAETHVMFGNRIHLLMVNVY